MTQKKGWDTSETDDEQKDSTEMEMMIKRIVRKIDTFRSLQSHT